MTTDEFDDDPLARLPGPRFAAPPRLVRGTGDRSGPDRLLPAYRAGVRMAPNQ